MRISDWSSDWGSADLKVLILVVSNPASGSVTPKQAFCSPATSGFSQRCFCSGVPCTTTACGPNKLIWIAEAAEKPTPEDVTLCIINAASSTPSQEPPPAPGMVLPSPPPPALAWTKDRQRVG